MRCEFCGAPGYRIPIADIPTVAMALPEVIEGPEVAVTCRLHEAFVRIRHEPIRAAYHEGRAVLHRAAPEGEPT